MSSLCVVYSPFESYSLQRGTDIQSTRLSVVVNVSPSTSTPAIPVASSYYNVV